MPMHSSSRSLIHWLLIASLGIGFAARADDLSDVQNLYASGKADAAIQRADRFLAANPKDPQMRFLKGVLLADANRDVEAIALFETLSEDYPDLAEPYNNLAALYARGGDYAKARATLEQALRTNPAYATAHENLGDVHAALAAQSYARALKFEPGSVTVPRKLALVRELVRRPGRNAAGASAPSAATAQ